MWFKILLSLLFFANIIAAFVNIGKGKHQMEITPAGQAFALIVYILIIFGIWFVK